ncbi:MAG: TonB-dependent receptor [Gammaproteobacteria bacterium]|nr:TonB-dependent receptor [Gammaproteobacteria bacterium]
MTAKIVRRGRISRRPFRHPALVPAALALLVPLSAPLPAQQLEEVVVTARKAEERLQDVPLSIAAFSSDDIESSGARDLYDLTRFTPGFTFEKFNRYGAQGGVSRPVIRGMSNILGEGNASVFVDGILYSDSILAFPMDIVERVEVIKGPQAALFGRATFSGAINFITKKGSNEPENRVSLRAADYGDYEVNLLSRGAISEDRLFYVAHGRFYTFDGMYRNTIDGRKVGGEESKNFNGALEFRPSETFSATLSAGYSKDDDDLAAVVLQDRYSNNCYLTRPRQYYCGEVIEQNSVTLDRPGLQGKEGIDRESTRVSAALRWNLGDYTLTSNSGFFSTESEYGYDSTYQAATALALTTIPMAPGAVRAATDVVRRQSVLRNEVSDRDEWSTELRLDSPSDRAVRWMLGGYYYTSDRTLVELHFAGTAPPVDSGETRIDNWAVFGSVAWDITDQFSLTGELRRATDTIGNFKPTTGLIEREFESTSPRVTARYKFSPQLMGYANWARGNKPGVINADPRFPPDIQFADEEESENYEIGVKSTLLDGRLTANIAAFYIDWTNQQITSTFVFPTGGTQSYILNAAKSEVKGVELELEAALTERLTAGLSYSYVNAEFVELNDAEANELFGNPSVAGKHPAGVPANQAGVFGRYGFELGPQTKAFVRADASYTSRKYDQVFNLASTGDRTIVNLSAGLERERWTASVFVDNLTDDRTPSTVVRYVDQMNLNVPQAINPSPALNNVAGSTATERAFFYPLAPKRQVGLRFSMRF